MKKTFLSIAIIILGGLTIYAQDYRLFKVDLASGYSRPSVKGLKAGFNLSLEPKFNITNHLAIGAKVEGVLLAAVSNTTTGDGTLTLLRSFSLTSEYYFGKKNVRPFIGISGGMYKSFSLDTDAEDIEDVLISEDRFGFAPRAGLQIGHFRIGAEYNLVKDNDYLSIKIGTTLGGGRK